MIMFFPIWPVSFRFSFWFFFHKRCDLYGLLYSETHAHKCKCMYNIQSSCNTLVHVRGNVHLLARPWLQFGLSLYIEYGTLWIIFFNKIRKPIVKQLTLITFFTLGRRTYGRSMWAWETHIVLKFHQIRMSVTYMHSWL